MTVASRAVTMATKIAEARAMDTELESAGTRYEM